MGGGTCGFLGFFLLFFFCCCCFALFLDRYVTVFDLHEKCEPQVMISGGHLGRVKHFTWEISTDQSQSLYDGSTHSAKLDVHTIFGFSYLHRISRFQQE